MTLRGLLPFAHASVLPPALRALIVASAAAVSAMLAGAAMLRAEVRGGWGRIYAGAVGVVGPLVALFLLRTLEQAAPEEAQAWDLAKFALVPLASAASVLVLGWVFAAATRARKLAPPAGG